MRAFSTYEELLEHLRERGHSTRALGAAPDGLPVVAARGGGDREPAIFISAGSHSTEQAGVRAAVELLESLCTEHQVHVVPTRDPMGMNGFAHVLGLALGEAVEVGSVAQLEAVLRGRGEVLYEDGEVVLGLMGEYGFATDNLLGRWQQMPGQLFEPLRGRRIYIPLRKEGVAGAAPFERAYTLVVSPEGEVLHLNRFHDTAWAPAEVRCTRRLLEEIRPGICFDLHESTGIGASFWLSARKQAGGENQQWEERIAREVIAAIEASGAELVPAEYRPAPFFDCSQRAVFWLDATRRGQGLNLMDYCSRLYGLAFGTEMGMFGTFEQRVRMGMLTVQKAVEVFAERHR